jgi:antitoxin (DNA-binding transcriptional repressor) of toxin-antitoxin stability system
VSKKFLALPLLGSAIAIAMFGPAGGEAPSSLGVYSGRAIATPIGVDSRVPAESAGGVIYSEARLEIGKARATAAGQTTGELAETFLATEVSGYSNPVLVTAQYPPSAVYKSEATSPTGVGSGGTAAGYLHAVADAMPSATGEAEGGAGGVPGVFGIGSGSSRTRSEVRADGTVVTTAVSKVHDVRIGPDLAPLFTIGAMTATATVSIPLGGTPKTNLVVEISGALVAGVPVTITQNGITVANSVPVPATAVTSVNQALAQLGALGISVRGVPVDKQATDSQATVSGAALAIGYVLPAAAQLPTDIGKNETVLLGQVSANATGRKRVPLHLDVAALGATDSLPSVGSGLPAETSQALAPSVSSSPRAAVSGPEPFRLPAHSRNIAVERLVAGYKIFVLTALVAAAAYALRSRAHA